MLKYIGIDPGKGGAVAVLTWIVAEKRWARDVFSTPVVSAAAKGTSNRGYDQQGMLNLIAGVAVGHECYAAMELVHSMPNDGHQGAFSFGYGFALWQMALTACAVPVTLVDPKKWKNYYGLSRDHDYEARKAKSLELARLKFPDCLAKLARVKDHDRAEALLIAEWHRKRHLFIRNAMKFDWHTNPPESQGSLPPSPTLIK